MPRQTALTAKPRLIIIAADYHPEITAVMIKTAADTAHQAAAVILAIHRVPGCFELPLITQHILRQKEADALVVLGYIEKGETLHGEIMGQVVYRSLVDLQLKFGLPIGLGIIGPGATLKQAQARQESTARAAVNAALASYQLLNPSYTSDV